jgi:hypothetical protein
VSRARTAAALACATLIVPASSAGQRDAGWRWTQLAQVTGAVDVAGPRVDGRFVVASHQGLFLMRKNGTTTPFARGVDGYVAPAGEPYIALAQTRRVPGAGCSYRRDDVYALDPSLTPGVVKIARNGRARRFLDFGAGSFPSSIAFDTVGRFGYRLLVTTTVSGSTTLHAIDCRARTRVMVTRAPHVEGGSAVAPESFKPFGGRLIAADELTGRIVAFAARGHVRVVARPNVPAGGDLGVEALGFAPRTFTRRGVAFLADLGAPGSPTQGTDSVLRLEGAPIRPGDLVVATEAGGVTIVVRCNRRCTLRRVARALDATHAEGHIAFAPR